HRRDTEDRHGRDQPEGAITLRPSPAKPRKHAAMSTTGRDGDRFVVVKKAGPMVIALWKQQWPKSRANCIPVYLAPLQRVQLAFSRQRQPGTAMIDGRDEVLGSAEAERAMANGLDLVVHALDGSVGEADLGPGKNSIQVGAQHLCEFLERLQ